MSNEKQRIAKRVAQEMQDGFLVNLGIGLPTLVADYIGEKHITLQSENGMIEMGEIANPENDNYDIDISNAGGTPVYILKGGAFFDTAMSFSIIRGGHVDVTVLGAFQVDVHANIASYLVPGKMIAGMGGAMDLVVGAKKVIIAMLHTNKGIPKILKECTLPLTAQAKVNMIVTEMGVFEYNESGLILIEKHEEYSIEDIAVVTEAKFQISDTLKAMEDV